MLRLTDLKKDYKVADSYVPALKGINLAFRRSEFVSVLGPSGCGKTTLLNIIGGLDKYTSGDVAVSGVSTKKFRDADWDVYRNHRIGFIFQSYNLIPHQTVLGNVELALTIAGVGKQERTERAKRALDRVGLSGEYNKRPNQLSGGQCQRVAIARALVNEPEILLADEPTGALDTGTSVQIMELIKEIASEKLVIMVTHNPELAEKYSTRIIRLLDGEVVDDSMPYSFEDEAAEVAAEEQNAEEENISEVTAQAENAEGDSRKKGAKKAHGREKAKMSPLTAFRLSAQNLFTKKARTIMTSIAGAIGIIGVSLVLALSYGVRSYINNMQNDMLSGNPITIEQQAFDMNALLGTMNKQEEDALAKQKAEEALREGRINVDSMVEYLVDRKNEAGSLMVENEITEEYVEFVKALPASDVASVFLDYGLDMSNNIYTDFKQEKEKPDDAEITAHDVTVRNTQKASLSAIRTQYIAILKDTVFKEYAAYITTIVDNFSQAPADRDYVLEQYDIVSGRYPTEKDEVMIVLDEDSKLTDILLAQLGYYTQDEFMNLVFRGAGEEDQGMKDAYNPALDKETFSYEELLGKKFTWYPNDVVFTPIDGSLPQMPVMGMKYNSRADDKWQGGLDLKVVGVLLPKAEISYGCMSGGFYYTTALAEYAIEQNKDSTIVNFYNGIGMSSVLSPYVQSEVPLTLDLTYTFDFVFRDSSDYSKPKGFKGVTGYVGTPNAMSAMMGALGAVFGGGQGSEQQSGGQEMYMISMQQLGGVELPERLAIYPRDFEHKANVLAYLDRWNADGDLTFTTVDGENITVPRSGGDADGEGGRKDVVYTDNLSIIISMINSFIDIVTIALVGFTALSLVVSTVMIAIITYVSVVERVKEIGVIRALGGRKKDVSRLFTAETAIIGLASGAIGILITYLLSAVINAIVGAHTIVARIAILPWWQALIMVGVSVALTLISGLFPSRAAAKKDPVVALRTE